MVLAEATWPEVESFSRDAVVLIPTGAVEQHGPHLPLMTDTLIVEEIAKAAEAKLAQSVILCPTLWLGASLHHLSFSGTLSASFESYHVSLTAVIQSMQAHRFHRFLVLNGHGGNSDSNRIALRSAKESNPNHTFAHVSYFDLIQEPIANLLQGPSKRMTHACEAETSLVLHLRPKLVRMEKCRKDGMRSQPEVQGLVCRFEEVTEEGSIGYPSYANAEKGGKLFDSAVETVAIQLGRMAETLVMVEI